MTGFNRRLLLAGLSAVILASCAPKTAEPDAVYYLVRHAEKTAEKPYPALTEAGQKRAQDLVARLKDAPLSAVYSTDFRRTRNTATPVAEDKGVSVTLYNARALEDFAKDLSTQKGHILVVGHSNTTPALAVFLGADAGAPIDDATEFDRLYVVQRFGEKIESEIQRYGERSE